MPFLSEKLLSNFFLVNTVTVSFYSLGANTLILGEIRWHTTERELKELSNALFCDAVAPLWFPSNAPVCRYDGFHRIADENAISEMFDQYILAVIIFI